MEQETCIWGFNNGSQSIRFTDTAVSCGNLLIIIYLYCNCCPAFPAQVMFTQPMFSHPHHLQSMLQPGPCPDSGLQLDPGQYTTEPTCRSRILMDYLGILMVNIDLSCDNLFTLQLLSCFSSSSHVHPANVSHPHHLQSTPRLSFWRTNVCSWIQSSIP